MKAKASFMRQPLSSTHQGEAEAGIGQGHGNRIRLLKVEADGDQWKQPLKPKIRLIGRWLERAGFIPGSHVLVKRVAHGLLELRSENIERRDQPEKIQQ
jgi:hypothetical protein